MKRFTYLYKNNKLQVLTNFLVAFGAIWLCIECPSFFSKDFENFIKSYWGILLFAVIFISFIYGCCRSFPRLNYNQSFKASNTAITIKVGNLLKESCDIVVGSSDFLDTDYDLESGISLKSQIINRFFNSDKTNVDRLIDESIQRQNLENEYIDDKPMGKKEKYPIGTVAILGHNNRKIYLTVITNLKFYDKQKYTEASPQKLATALNSLWDKIKTDGRMKEVSLPILGSGLSSVNLSHLLLMQSIILSFVVYSKKTRITDRLNIVIHENNYDPNDFEEVVKFLKTIQI